MPIFPFIWSTDATRCSCGLLVAHSFRLNTSFATERLEGTVKVHERAPSCIMSVCLLADLCALRVIVARGKPCDSFPFDRSSICIHGHPRRFVCAPPFRYIGGLFVHYGTDTLTIVDMMTILRMSNIAAILSLSHSMQQVDLSRTTRISRSSIFTQHSNGQAKACRPVLCVDRPIDHRPTLGCAIISDQCGLL